MICDGSGQWRIILIDGNRCICYWGAHSVDYSSGTITDHEGKFSLKVAQGTDSCQLVVEFIGYSKVSQEFVPDKSQLNLGAIVLKEDAISLEGATVSAKEVVQKSTVEHTTINASSNISSGKGTAIDILRSASSVSVADNEILIRGNAYRRS